MGEDDQEVLRRAYAAWNDGDVERMLEQFDPDVEWRPGADDPHGGVHRGREGFERWTRSWGASFESLRLEPGRPRAVAGWQLATVTQRGRPKRSSAEIETAAVHAWRIRDGRACAWYSFPAIGEAIEFVAAREEGAYLDVVRAGYEAFNRGDIEGALETLHPEIEWRTYIVPGPGGGTYRGHDGVRELWADARRIFGEFRNVPERLFDAGEHAVAFVRVEGVGSQSGAAVQARIAHVFSFRGGLVSRVESFEDRDTALRAAGLDPALVG